MNRQWAVRGGIGVMIVGAVLAGGLHKAQGYGATVSPAATDIVQYLIGGGGLMTFLGWAAQYLPQLGLSAQSTAYAIEAVNVGRIGVYAKLYRESKDDAEKAKLREAARGVADSLFDTWFPLPPPEVKS